MVHVPVTRWPRTHSITCVHRALSPPLQPSASVYCPKPTRKHFVIQDLPTMKRRRSEKPTAVHNSALRRPMMVACLFLPPELAAQETEADAAPGKSRHRELRARIAAALCWIKHFLVPGFRGTLHFCSRYWRRLWGGVLQLLLFSCCIPEAIR